MAARNTCARRWREVCVGCVSTTSTFINCIARTPRCPLKSPWALAELRQAGKIRHVGLSNVTLDELARAQEIVPIVSVQNHYNLAQRSSERMRRSLRRDD